MTRVNKQPHFFISFIILAICVFRAESTHAEDLKTERYTRYAGKELSFWVSKSIVENESFGPLTSQLRAQILKEKEHWIFSECFPDKWSITVDDESEYLQNFPAFFHPKEKAPDQTQTIFFRSNELRNAIQDKSLLLHEMIHLISHLHRPHEQSWVFEGIALLGEYLISGLYHPATESGFSKPETSLTTVIDHKSKLFSDREYRLNLYGHWFQYFLYIHRLCGGDELYKEFLYSGAEETGIPFVESVLKKYGRDPACKSFQDSFRNFQIARFLQYPGKGRNRFIFPTTLDSQKGKIREVKDLKEIPELPPYSATAYRLLPKQQPINSPQTTTKTASHEIAQKCLDGEVSLVERNACLRLRLE